MWKILLISFVVVVVIVVGDTSSSRSSKKSNSLVKKYVTLYQTENLDRVKSITRTARRDATDNVTFETQAILALSLQREERMRKIGKGYSGLASKRIRMALKAFEKAHELVESASSDLDRGLLYSSYALLLRESGDTSREKDAILYHDLSTRYAPEWDKMWLERGVTFQMLGQYENAAESYLRATKLPNSGYFPCVRYAHVHKFRSDVKQDLEMIDRMQHMLKDRKNDGGSISDEIRVQEIAELHFACAKAFTEMNNIQMAATHYKKGNKWWSKIAIYDPNVDLRREQVMRNVFGPQLGALWMRREARGLQSESIAKAPIFIIGRPRSGSTLVEQIISSHSDVFGAGEDTLFSPMMSKLLTKFISGGEPIDILQEYGERYVKTMLRRAHPLTRFTDKNLQNFWYLGLLHLVLPHAKVVHVYRDPRAACFSMYKSLFLQGGKKSITESYDQKSLAHSYATYEKMMRYWQDTIPSDQLFSISYEHIVLDFNRSVSRLAKFLDLDLQPEMFEFWKNSRVVQTASHGQVNTPLYTSSLDSWRRFEPYLKELLDELPPDSIRRADDRITSLLRMRGSTSGSSSSRNDYEL